MEETHADEEPHFVFPVSQNLICPVCQDLFSDPVITAECGHSFCRQCLLQVLANGRHGKGECPLCRTNLAQKNAHSNLALAGVIGELLVKCKYWKEGCTEQLKLGDRYIHETDCQYAPLSCVHQEFGCRWRGTKGGLDRHLQNCVYESLKPFIMKTTQLIASLQATVETQEREISRFKRIVGLRSSQERRFQVPEEQEKEKEKEDGRISSEITPIEELGELVPENSWNIDDIRCIYTLTGHDRGVTALGINEQYLFSGSHDCSIKVWDVNGVLTRGAAMTSVSCKQSLTGHKYSVWSLELAEDRLYSGSSDGTIKVWDLTEIENIKCIDTLSGSRKIYSLHLRDNYLFSGGTDRQVQIWDRQTNRSLHTLAGHKDTIWSFASHNNLLFSASDDRTIKVWDLNSFNCIRTLSYESSKILAMTITDGYLCMGTTSCKVGIWDLNTFGLLKELSGHVWEVWQLASHGSQLFSGSFDHTIKVWDMATFDCLKTLEGHKGYVHALKASPEYLVSGSGDKTIKVWAATS